MKSENAFKPHFFAEWHIREPDHEFIHQMAVDSALVIRKAVDQNNAECVDAMKDAIKVIAKRY
jgi:hypothetical protein